MGQLVSSQLHALVELSRTGSMAATAEALGYTPGAISQQIARLEQVIGVPLVSKVGRGVRLTDAGRVLARHAQQLLREEEVAVSAARATSATIAGQVTIGVFGTTSASILSPVLISALARQHPGIEVRSREVPVDDCGAAVARGLVDVAFGVDYSAAPIPRAGGIEFVTLRSERFDLAGGPDLARRQEISLVDVADAPWVLAARETHYSWAWYSACRSAGFEPDVRHEITDTAATLALAQAGLAVAPVTPLMRRLVRSDVPVVRLRESIERQVVLIRHRLDRDRPIIAATVAAAQQAISAV